MADRIDLTRESVDRMRSLAFVLFRSGITDRQAADLVRWFNLSWRLRPSYLEYLIGEAKEESSRGVNAAKGGIESD